MAILFFCWSTLVARNASHECLGSIIVRPPDVSSGLQFSFPPRGRNGKKTQQCVVGPENRREDLRDRAQSIGDGFNASQNAPVARSTPNSLGERSD